MVSKSNPYGVTTRDRGRGFGEVLSKIGMEVPDVGGGWSKRTPEISLITGLIIDAMDIVHQGRYSRKFRTFGNGMFGPGCYGEAYRWFIDRRTDSFSFIWCCFVVDIDAGEARKRILLDAPAPYRRGSRAGARLVPVLGTKDGLEDQWGLGEDGWGV